MENNNMKPKNEQGKPKPENVKNRWEKPEIINISIRETNLNGGNGGDGLTQTIS